LDVSSASREDTPVAGGGGTEKGKLLWNRARFNTASIKQQYKHAKGEFKANPRSRTASVAPKDDGGGREDGETRL